MPVQPEKASEPMLVTLLGMATDARLAQFAKAKFSISITPNGISNETRPTQLVKAPLSMTLSEEEKVTEVN